MSETVDESKSQKINVPVSANMKAEIEQAAWERRITVAELVRGVLAGYLHRRAVGDEAYTPTNHAEHKFGGSQ